MLRVAVRALNWHLRGIAISFVLMFLLCSRLAFDGLIFTWRVDFSQDRQILRSGNFPGRQDIPLKNGKAQVRAPLRPDEQLLMT